MLNKFKIPLQFFAEGEPTANPPANPTATVPQGKVWTDEYVQGLREENKQRRLAEKTANTRIKTLLGLKEEEEIDDAKITAFQTNQSAKITAAEQNANAKLLLAEIKSMYGYDTQLVLRLVDKSKVTIDADGNITGLQEAVEALAIEFPQIKKAPATTGVNPLLPVGKDVELKAAYDEAIKRNDFVGANSIMYQIRQTKK